MFFRRSKDKERFEELTLGRLDELYRTARRLLGDRAAAEDAVQETYLRAWRSFDTFEQGTNCRAWLFRILINSVHDHRRRNMALAAAGESAEILERQPAPAVNLGVLTDEEILSALDRLSLKLREAVLLADVEEFTYREIAELLDVPIGTVMSRVSRGRAELRALLGSKNASHGAASMARTG